MKNKYINGIVSIIVGVIVGVMAIEFNIPKFWQGWACATSSLLCYSILNDIDRQAKKRRKKLRKQNENNRFN